MVEDTPVTFEMLISEGFSVHIIDAIRALTKLPKESRMEAALRAAVNPIARVVKLADNSENMDLSRIPNPTEKDHVRQKEYQKVRELLLSDNLK